MWFKCDEQMIFVKEQKIINHKLPNFATKEQQDQEPDSPYRIVYKYAVRYFCQTVKKHIILLLHHLNLKTHFSVFQRR